MFYLAKNECLPCPLNTVSRVLLNYLFLILSKYRIQRTPNQTPRLNYFQSCEYFNRWLCYGSGCVIGNQGGSDVLWYSGEKNCKELKLCCKNILTWESLCQSILVLFVFYLIISFSFTAGEVTQQVTLIRPSDKDFSWHSFITFTLC